MLVNIWVTNTLKFETHLSNFQFTLRKTNLTALASKENFQFTLNYVIPNHFQLIK